MRILLKKKDGAVQVIYFVKRGFRGHEKSENHVNAMIAWNEHKKKNLDRHFNVKCPR